MSTLGIIAVLNYSYLKNVFRDLLGKKWAGILRVAFAIFYFIAGLVFYYKYEEWPLLDCSYFIITTGQY